MPEEERVSFAVAERVMAVPWVWGEEGLDEREMVGGVVSVGVLLVTVTVTVLLVVVRPPLSRATAVIL